MRQARAALIAIAFLLAGAAPGEDAFDRAVVALTAGTQAADERDLTHLRSAARALRASGAQPVAGVDMAALWLRQARGAALPAERNRALGPGYRTLHLVSGGSATFEQTFLAGQMARIAVIPMQQSDFLMRISEDGRAVLCNASRAHARCDWVPSYTARFRIEIQNPGRQAGRYFLMMQ